MPKGYQILELSPLDNLAKWPHHHILLMPVLFWLIDKINEQSNEELKHVQLEVIKAQYHGPGYPSIGIHYFNKPNPKDVGQIVEAAAERFLNEKTALDFIKFVENRNVNWNDVLKKLMTDDTDAKQ